jgi:hypothetical protein
MTAVLFLKQNFIIVLSLQRVVSRLLGPKNGRHTNISTLKLTAMNVATEMSFKQIAYFFFFYKIQFCCPWNYARCNCMIVRCMFLRYCYLECGLECANVSCKFFKTCYDILFKPEEAYLAPIHQLLQ